MSEYVDPTRETFAAFRADQRDGPIHMLNLVSLFEKARYADGHLNADKGLSGADAYRLYGEASAPVFKRLGGRIVWRGALETMLIGPQTGEQWDHIFIAEYPSVAAFVDMIRDRDYREAVRHRQAAVRTSRLMRTRPLDVGDGFQASS